MWRSAKQTRSQDDSLGPDDAHENRSKVGSPLPSNPKLIKSPVWAPQPLLDRPKIVHNETSPNKRSPQRPASSARAASLSLNPRSSGAVTDRRRPATGVPGPRQDEQVQESPKSERFSPPKRAMTAKLGQRGQTRGLGGKQEPRHQAWNSSPILRGESPAENAPSPHHPALDSRFLSHTQSQLYAPASARRYAPTPNSDPGCFGLGSTVVSPSKRVREVTGYGWYILWWTAPRGDSSFFTDPPDPRPSRPNLSHPTQPEPLPFAGVWRS